MNQYLLVVLGTIASYFLIDFLLSYPVPVINIILFFKSTNAILEYTSCSCYSRNQVCMDPSILDIPEVLR